MLIVRSPVRISFGGGGTDLPGYYEKFGGAVVSTTINKYFYTVLGKRTDGNIQVISSDLRVVEAWRDIRVMSLRASGSELEIPLAVLKHVNRDISVDLFLASEIPPGTGLGSSASVCVNLLKTVYSYLRIPLSKHALAEKAYEIARTDLQKPVGKQDEYAAAFGGLNYFHFERDGSTEVTPLNVESTVLKQLQSNLLLFFTGAAHHSWSILDEQERSTRAGSAAMVESLHEIRELADEMKAVLEAGDLTRFGALLDQGWRAKKRVSDKISTSAIDDLYTLAKANGASGGKITGAGGGGFLLLYCEAPFQAQVSAAFAQRGIRQMHFAFDLDGARVLVNDPFIDSDDNCGSFWTFAPSQKRAPSSSKSPEATIQGLTRKRI